MSFALGSYPESLFKQFPSQFEAVTGVSQPVVEHTTEYYDVVEIGTDPNNINIDENDEKWLPSARHLKELSDFQAYKDKPEREQWVAHWTMIY